MRAVGYYMKAGWKGPILFYEFWCPIHKRQVINYPQGYAQNLICPICQEEERIKETQNSSN